MNNHFVKYAMLLATMIGYSSLFTSCKEEPCDDLNQVQIGEFRNGTPYLTYENPTKLTRAMQLAFLPSMVIDSVFLYKEKESDEGVSVILAASGQESDSVYTTVSFSIKASLDKPIIWGPVGPDPVWCKGYCIEDNHTFTRCMGTNNDCSCMPGDRPCPVSQVVTGGVSRPKDIARILIPYLASK